MQAQSGKFCLSCQRYNEPKSTFCAYCRAPLENTGNRPLTTSQIGGPDLVASKSKRHQSLPPPTAPETGIAFYFIDDSAPFEVRVDDEFIIGRKTDDMPEKMVDLSNYDAFGHGISRRHARIRRTPSGYEITDLDSTNGTWIDEQHLSPNMPYPFASGILLRLGRMRIYAVYKKPA